MMLNEVVIPSFLFFERAKIVQPGVRQPGTTDYVAALMYSPANDAFVLDKEPTQPYHTLPGGRIEDTDQNLLTGMLRELVEEVPERSIVHLDENGPLVTISCPETELSPKQRIHLFTGVIEHLPSFTPMMPAWFLSSATEYMSSILVAQSLSKLLKARSPHINTPCQLGFRQELIVQYPYPQLARLSILTEAR